MYFEGNISGNSVKKLLKFFTCLFLVVVVLRPQVLVNFFEVIKISLKLNYRDADCPIQLKTTIYASNYEMTYRN